MHRGLISWSKVELPEHVLNARVRRAQEAMAQAGVDILVVHTNPAREAGVAWFTGFIPYWNQCVMLLARTGRPTLVAGLSNRMQDWVVRNAHVDSVVHAAKIGVEAGGIIAHRKPQAIVAIADLNTVPTSVIEGISAHAASVIDGTGVLERVRNPADSAELALSFRAATIARAALATARAEETDAAALVAAIDGEARRLGAEEAFVAVAPDLKRDHKLVRLEGTLPLGSRFAVRVSLAYKGTWVRMLRTLVRDPAASVDIASATERFAAAIATLPRTDGLQPFGSWLIEGCRTTTPLEPLIGTALEDAIAVPAGGVVTVQATMEDDAQALLVGAPVLVGRDDEPSSLLVPPQFDDGA